MSVKQTKQNKTMNDNTNAAVEEVTEAPETNGAEPTKDNTVVKVKRGNAVLELDGISEGNFAGFKFWRPTFETLESATDHFTAISKTGKSGEDIILTLVNSALGARHRSLANSKLTIPANIKNDKAKSAAFVAERDAKLNSQNPEDRILISQDDAYEYIPGEREVDSLSGLNSQKKKLFNAAVDAKKAYAEAVKKDDKELAAKLANEVKTQVTKYQEIVNKIKEKEAEEQSAILELISE